MKTSGFLFILVLTQITVHGSESIDQQNLSTLNGRKMRVAIIGAGAAGLVSARFCTDPEFNFSCDIFEQTDELGGTWVYNPKTGVDEYGLPIHSSMYQDLITNLPKEIMKFPDFDFPKYNRSFITQEQVLKFLQDYAKHHDLEKYIKYRHLVINVQPLPNNRWAISYTDLKAKNNLTEEYDAVLVCNGHFSRPAMPNIPGKDIFKGRQIHSHDYRSSNEFKNKIVLVIGAGPSGYDITMKTAKFASEIVVSYKTMKRPWKIPQNVTLKPITVRLTENSAIFEDGTSRNIDAVIYCTGYDYSFPFLSKDCGIKVESNTVQPLYKHFVNIEKPTMAITGITFATIPFPIFYYQVQLFLKHLNGDITLPTKEEMYLDTQKDLELRKEKGFPKRYSHKLSYDFQEPYFTEIAKIAKIKPLPPVIFKIYANVTRQPDTEVNFEIIDDNNFVRTEL